jgi:hypothetical protein
MRFAIWKGQIHFRMQKRLGQRASFILQPFQALTDWVFRLMK